MTQRAGFVVGDDGPAFLPLFLGFEMDNSVRHVEVGLETPPVLLAKAGWKSVLYDLGNGLSSGIRKRWKEFRGWPSRQTSAEVDSVAKNTEVL